MKSPVIRIGSRESQLAVRQAEIVMDLIRRAAPHVTLELVTMKTTGDRILDRRLDQIGGKGLFVKELDQALRDGRIDVSVHSLKDMPMEVPDDLPLVAYTKREDPRDVLIYREGCTEKQLQQGAVIGSSSQRRILQLQTLYPNCSFESIRGNIQTRLKKLIELNYSATVLAYAGVHRLAMDAIIGRCFSTDEIIPAAGQGIVAVQARRGELTELMQQINCIESEVAARCERSFVQALNGGCSSPIAAYAEIKGQRLCLKGLYAEPAASTYMTAQIEGEIGEAERLGRALAAQLKAQVKGNQT